MSDGHRCPRGNNVLEEQVTHYVFGREKRELLITEQTSLTPPEGYIMERLVGKSHDEAVPSKDCRFVNDSFFASKRS